MINVQLKQNISNNNQSLGLDGFSIQFCRVFWNDLKVLFLDCVDYSFANNQLFSSPYEQLRTRTLRSGENHNVNVTTYNDTEL